MGRGHFRISLPNRTPTACQPPPTACQPTPTACQPTPTSCQPTPTACQPTPTACQPTPHGMSADPHGVSADTHGVSTSHLGHAAVDSECECSRPPPFPPPTHYPRHAGVERTFWPRLRKLCAASSSRLLSELWRHMLVAALKRTTTGEILLWMIPSEPPKALQASECSELLDPMRASCQIPAQH